MINRKTGGFTLIELLLATIILAIGLIGTSAFFYANRRNLYNARLEREATWKAVERMEWVKGLSSSELQEELPADEQVTENNILIGNNVSATRTTEKISPLDEEDADLLWEIEVKVSWADNREVSLNTYVPK